MVNIGYDQAIIDIINKYGADIIGDEKFEQEKKNNLQTCNKIQ